MSIREFLKKKGFKILERNINKKWGELDIVVQDKRTKRIHIIEVKTVSGDFVSTQAHPVENLTRSKLDKLMRTSILYTKENDIEDWQLDAVLVWWDQELKTVRVQYLEKVY